MDRSPNGPRQGSALRDRLVTCLWWLIFLGGVAGGTAIGVVLTLCLVLSTPTGFLLIGACWLVGNGVGARLATRLDAALARTDSDRNRRGRSGIREVVARWNLNQCGDAGVQVTSPYAHAVSGVAVPRRVLACP